MQGPRPNLFLIGAMKSGTSYLWELLAAHPAIFTCTPKEPSYFVDPKVLRRVWPWAWEQGYWRGLDRYLGLFADAGDAKVIAEASTFYSQLPMFSGVPERILNFNPRARFIYVMRDPVERAISHYWHRVRWWGESRSPLAAIRGDQHYRDVSHYSRQLQAYLQHVGHDRIYVLTHETLVSDPLGQMARIYRWLGVDARFRPSIIGVPDNALPTVVEQVVSPGLLDRLRRSVLFQRVGPYVPAALRKVGARFVATRRVRPGEVDTQDVKDFLRPIQQAQTEELCTLLNRSFPEWQTLYGPKAAATCSDARLRVSS